MYARSVRPTTEKRERYATSSAHIAFWSLFAAAIAVAVVADPNGSRPSSFCSRGNIIMSFAKKIDKTIRPSVRLLTGKRRETLLTFDDHSTNNTQQKI
jgi:hypothetical protein